MIGRQQIRLAWAALGFAATASLAGCTKEPPPRQLPEVTVSPPLQQDVVDYAEFTGTITGYETVEIRARVKGFLESIHFEDGQKVEQGDLLYSIDPKPFQAKVDQAQADLEIKKTQLQRGETEYKRNQDLMAEGAGTDRDLVEARTARDSAKAAVDAAKAVLDEAELDLGYTLLTAPIDGIISRTLVDVGNLVGDTEATLLTTIVKHDPVHVYFDVSERVVLGVLKFRRENERSGKEVKMFLGLADEEGYPHEGRIDFLDNRIDTATGTALVRGEFDNKDGFLYPGLFVRVRIPLQTQENALLVNERALGTDLGGKYLLVVGKNDVVEQRHVESGALVDGMRVIRKGISAADRYIVKGLQRARPGLPVSPRAERPAEQPPKQEAEPPETGG